MNPSDKPLVWIRAEIRTPPLSAQARQEAGFLLRKLQAGETLSLPHSRPMPSIAARCHELRIADGNANWRIIYRVDPDAIVVVSVFGKTTRRTPQPVIELARKRLREYDAT